MEPLKEEEENTGPTDDFKNASPQPKPEGEAVDSQISK